MKHIAAFLAAILIICAIAPGTADSQAVDDPPVILRVAAQADIEGTNPFACMDDCWTGLMTRWLYDTPLSFRTVVTKLGEYPYTITTNYSMVPYIAIGSANVSGKAESWDDCAIGNFGYCPKESWQSASFKEAIVFYDFENVKWHDGHPMDVRDVLFSYHAAAQHPLWRADVECLEADNYSEENWLHIEKVWESGTRAALRFTLRTPYWQFFNRTLGVMLLPEHIWAYTTSGQKVDGTKIWCDAGYNPGAASSWSLDLAMTYECPDPVGSGTFKWGEWSPGQHLNLTTWRDHFFKPGFKYEDDCLDEYGESLAVQPHIDGMSFGFYSTPEAAVLALKENQMDYISWSVPPSFVQELANAPGIALQQSPNQGFAFVGYNMRRQSFGYNETGCDVGKPLRKAIAHCIDKNRIITRLLYSPPGVAGAGPISSLSPWYNATIPRYSFDPDEAKSILANAGYKVNVSGQLLSGAEAMAAAGDGTWWLNPDGSPIGSGAGGMIEILVVNLNQDQIQAQAGLMIAQQLRDIGVNAESTAPTVWDRDLVGERNFDMYIDFNEVNSQPPEFLYDLFHSRYAEAGLNTAGYANASFDEVMELARSTDNETVRKSAVFEAQAAICYDLPWDALYFRTAIEAYRSDRFTGWTAYDYSTDGTLFNPSSIRLIVPARYMKLNAQFVSLPSAIVSESMHTIVTVYVRDQDGAPVEGAKVWLNASQGTLNAETGFTGPSGKFTTTYNAPFVDPLDPESCANGTQVIIQIKEATYTDPGGYEYEPAPSRLALITVYPGPVPFLSVAIAADPDIMQDGNASFTLVTVRVTDSAGDAVQGAEVALTVSPAVPIIEPETVTTDADGKAVFKVWAVDLPDDNGETREYYLKALVVYEGDTTLYGQNMCPLSIIDSLPAEEPIGPGDSALAQIAVFVVVGAVLACAVIYILYRLRRNR